MPNLGRFSIPLHRNGTEPHVHPSTCDNHMLNVLVIFAPAYQMLSHTECGHAACQVGSERLHCMAYNAPGLDGQDDLMATSLQKTRIMT